MNDSPIADDYPHYRLLDEIERQREALEEIRDITDPETHTEQPPMAAIRDVLEDTNG